MRVSMKLWMNKRCGQNYIGGHSVGFYKHNTRNLDIMYRDEMDQNNPIPSDTSAAKICAVSLAQLHTSRTRKESHYKQDSQHRQSLMLWAGISVSHLLALKH